MRNRWVPPVLVACVLALFLSGCGGGGGGVQQVIRVVFTLPVARSFVQGTIVTLEAQATVSSGTATIARVVFAANGTNIATATTAPYQALWNTTGLAPGDYTITATAYDNSNPARSASATITITITASPVAVSITAPPAGSRVVNQGATVTISATASAPSGIARVEFTANGTPIGTATTPVGGVYSVLWSTSGLTPGIYNIQAKAYDRRSPPQTGIATIQIEVRVPPIPGPTVQIDSPSNGATVAWNVNVTASAQAQAPGARIARIEVTLGTLATRTIPGTGTANLTGQVSFDTTALSDGLHTITAVATDTTGRQASASIQVNVANSISPPPPPF